MDFILTPAWAVSLMDTVGSIVFGLLPMRGGVRSKVAGHGFASGGVFWQAQHMTKHPSASAVDRL